MIFVVPDWIGHFDANQFHGFVVSFGLVLALVLRTVSGVSP